MSVFIDTSALLAVLDAADEHHDQAVRVWHALAEVEAPLVTSNYVIVETVAVVQNRLGIGAVRTLMGVIVPLLDVVFVEAAIHGAAVSALLAAGRRHLSLVDCASFEIMRQLRVRRAFAYDRHFEEQGFECESGS